jgi:hypothetical protein
MKFINKWLLKKMKYCWDHSDEIEGYGKNNINQFQEVCVDTLSSISLNSRSIRFSVYRANGGMVIETDYYDDKNDRRINNLHVCTDLENLGEELSKILTLETLKQ